MTELRPSDPSAEVNTRAHRIIAWAVLVIALIVYFSTIAPTTSFWDCGEFIACSYSMGVPHPPGAPFYLLLGRFFTLFAPLPDIGLRVNALSALVSALTVLLSYLITVRLVRRWRGPEHSTTDKWVLYGSGVVAAFAFAFSHSFWWNAVEAEVYAISMFFTAFVFWLAVRWTDHHDTPLATKYLLLIALFVGLAIGIHLLNVLALSPIIMLIYFIKYRFTWKGFIIALAISMGAILVVYPGVVGGVPALLEGGVFLLAIAVAVLVGLTVWAIRERRNLAAIVLASLVLILIGYSTYAVVYIRSNLDPEINENQPDTVQRMISYLNREQYGAVGPIALEEYSPQTTRRLQREGAAIIPLAGNNVLRLYVLERNAPLWSYQINEMYIRYLSWQFFINERGRALIFPFLFGLLGMIWHFWRDPKRAFSVGLLFLMTGLAIVFYLNQDDPQPRERDYAYVGSFFAFSLWIGMGVAALFEFVEDLVRNRGPALKRGIAVGSVVVTAVLVPLSMVLANYKTHDRTGNYVAWDYSRNMLETAEQDGIIFTNGDNDTFPLWYLQVVEGLRRDVRVVNLSLLNTNWYIKQLRDKQPQVPIGLSDRDIDNRLTGMSEDALYRRYWPSEPELWRRYREPNTSPQTWRVRTTDGGLMEWKVPATMHIPTGMRGEQAGEPNFLRVQDIMILHIVEQNRWRKPIYFAVTVSNSNLVGLEEYMTMEGLLFRLKDGKAPEIDERKLPENLFETYRGHYRNLNNPDVYYFPNVVNLLQNYRSGYLQLVYRFYRQMQSSEMKAPSGVPEEQWSERFAELSPSEKALHTLRTMDEIITLEAVPQTNRDVSLQIARLYFELGDDEHGSKHLQHVIDLHGGDPNAAMQVAFYWGEYGGDTTRTAGLVSGVLAKNDDLESLFGAAAIYERLQMHGRLAGVVERIRARPGLTLQDRLDLGTFYFTLKDYDSAISLYEQLARENPGNGEVFGSLLGAYQQKKDSAGVRETLRRWIERNPDDTDARRMFENWGGSATEGGDVEG